MKLFKNNYHKRHFFAMFQTMLLPFMGFMALGVVDDGPGGGSSEGEDKLLEKIRKENKEKIDAYKVEIKQLFDDSRETVVDKETFNTKFKELSDKLQKAEDEAKNVALKSDLDDLRRIVKGIGSEVKGIMEPGTDAKVDSLKEEIYKGIKKNWDTIKSFKASDRKDIGIAITIKGTIIRSDVASNTEANRVPGIGQIQRRRAFMRELFTSARVNPNNHGVIRYVDQENQTDNSAQISEAGAFPTSDIDWKERSLNIEKTGDHIKISREMMDDVDYVMSEINNFLLRNVALAVDAQLLSGTGSSPQLKGLASVATAFAAGTYAGTVQDAQLADLIAVIGTQIMSGTNYMPNAVLINPEDYTKKYKLVKDAENGYVKVPFAITLPSGETIIHEMLVIPNSGVTQNTMYCGDFTRGTVYSSNEVQIEMGYEDDDFTKDLVTVKARERLALLIRNVDAGAFVEVDDIVTALAAINAAGA